ncbi:MAG TPA: phenylalanine--tRNA ligase subunit beta, partial [Gaiellales bacterium]|nr:phenylalanine--tRNA ligase subunit beta [Gaiellales bacterium]
RLSVCTVDVGEGELRQIVCGAANFAAGDTVAVALPGAVLPDGTSLRVARLRGQESHGMMLSERELGLSGDHEGIMLLPAGWPVGDPLAGHLPIAETVIELEVTPNRPDCLNVYGVARELSAVFDRDLAAWPGREPAAEGEGSVENFVSARIDAPELCSRWAGRVFTDVRVGPSPAWLKARLAAAGMRPICNVVDITNYVMLAVGEPTHAFDLDRLEGGRIIVRRAADGERIVTLDGQERTLDSGMLVIADAEKPSAVAGLMGSRWSEVTDATTTVLVECANFDAHATQTASVRLKLRTEGSGRWEKGIDPHLVPHALALVSQLMVELCGARMVPGTIDLHGDLPDRPTVPLRMERLNGLIGVSYPPEEVDRILSRLGFEQAPGGWRAPSWRATEVTQEADLIEEVSRIAGLERVPAELPPRAGAVGRLTREQRLVRRVVETLIGTGSSEAVTPTLIDPGSLAVLGLGDGDRRAAPVALENPMGSDLSAMRTMIFPGLVTVAARNLAAGSGTVELFEIGNVFLPSSDPLPHQPASLCVLQAGPAASFGRVKGVVEVLYRALHAPLEVAAAGEPFLHPAAAAAIPGGFLGQLHPLTARALGVEDPVVVAEFELAVLLAAVPEVIAFRDVIAFPPVRQDIAVAVAEQVAAGQVTEIAREAGGPHLARVEVFDVYRGAQVGAGRKSLALHLVFRAPDRTLTDADADAARGRIVAALEARLGAELRR